MKKIHMLKLLVGALFYFAVCSGACSNSQKKVNTASDTLFIKKVIKEGKLYQAIYVLNYPKSEDCLKALSGFADIDKDNEDEYLASIYKKGVRLTKNDTHGLSSEWYPVYLYKSKYYLYSPSDKASKGHRIIKDSLVMFHWADGYMPIAIENIIKLKPNVFQIKTKHLVWQDGSMPDQIDIYLVDNNSKLYVWKYKYPRDTAFTYQLMTTEDNLNVFPLIVNYSIEKQKEFKFQDIDYEGMIENMIRK
jgi:hypothetical protein